VVEVGVFQVHAQQIRHEEPCLIAACAGADLNDDVAVVARVFGNQHVFQFSIQLVTPGSKFVQLQACHFEQLTISDVNQCFSFPGLCQVIFVLAGKGYDRFQVGAFLGKLRHELKIRPSFSQAAVKFRKAVEDCFKFL